MGTVGPARLSVLKPLPPPEALKGRKEIGVAGEFTRENWSFSNCWFDLETAALLTEACLRFMNKPIGLKILKLLT